MDDMNLEEERSPVTEPEKADYSQTRRSHAVPRRRVERFHYADEQAEAAAEPGQADPEQAEQPSGEVREDEQRASRITQAPEQQPEPGQTAEKQQASDPFMTSMGRQAAPQSAAVPLPRKEVPVPAALRNAVRPRTPNRAPVKDEDYMRRVPLGQSGPDIEEARERSRAGASGPVKAMAGHQTVRRPELPRGGFRPVPPEQEETEQELPPEEEPEYDDAGDDGAYDDGYEDDYDEQYDDGEERRAPRLWLGLLCVVLLLAACVIGLLLVP